MAAASLAQAAPAAARRCDEHDSTRGDGTLDDHCLRCGADGYWHDGHRHDRPHPSGKILLTLACPTVEYWRHWHNVRYGADKRLDRLALNVARRLPGRLRMWVVVDSANTSIFELHPRPDGYAGPDGLTYAHIYDGARRKATPGVPA
jgi:hypothetical protein